MDMIPMTSITPVLDGNSGTDADPTSTVNVAVSGGMGWKSIPSTSTTTWYLPASANWNGTVTEPCPVWVDGIPKTWPCNRCAVESSCYPYWENLC